MKNNEDSSFPQGDEGRVDSLSGAEMNNKGSENDQTKVISEIEKRFSAIFGDDNKELKLEAKTKEQPTVEEIILNAELADIKRYSQSQAEPALPSIAASSPLGDIKNIILSLEEEIDSEILNKYDAEINKLHALNEGNSTILGFLQILRFLGQYIRVKGRDSRHASMTLLLTIYNTLEDVILSEDMTDENKRGLLLDDIQSYREWAAQIDGGNDLLNLNSEKQELDLFLSSITGGEVRTVAAKEPSPEMRMPRDLQSDIQFKTESPDDTINMGKWEKTPFVLDNTYTKNAQSNPKQNWMEIAKSLDENSNEETKEFEPEDIHSHKITWIALIIVLLILFLIASGFLWFYPEKKNQARQWIALNIPYADKVLTVEGKQKSQDIGKIEFIDVQQRFIRNPSLGRNIRVIEGIVKNKTTAGISKVKLLGELYDAEGLLLLTSQASLAGNVLTDDKLEKLDEDKIFSALSIAPASNLSEAMIPPMGQVPFMIVFTKNPDRVFRLVVIPVFE